MYAKRKVPDTPRIIRRRLTPDEARQVHHALRETPNILGYTVRELLDLTDVFVAEEDGLFAGLCFSADMGRRWTEIAALLVLPHFRGQGLGNALFSAAWDRAWRRGRHVYVLSRNPQVVGWMKARGMDIAQAGRKVPFAVHGHLARHMASGYRWREGFRKRQAIHACPPLIQGIKRQW